MRLFPRKTPQITRNATVVALNAGTRELLSLMSFPAIPAEAHAIVFTSDGNAQFIEKFDPPVGNPIGSSCMVWYYENVDLEIQS